MTTYSITIGVPVYNMAASIRRSLQSLLAQTYGEFSIVVSDNVSTDGTAEICEEIAAADARVHVVHQDHNCGAFQNFCYLIDRATSTYFMWAAGDDCWHEQFLQRLIPILESRPDVGIAFPRSRIGSLKIPLVPARVAPPVEHLDSDDVFSRVSRFIHSPGGTLKANAFYGLWRTGLARRSLDAVRPLDLSTDPVGVDIAVLAYALTEAKIVQVPEILFYKSSKWFPLGSFADRMFNRVMELIGRRRPDPEIRRKLFAHADLLRTVLIRAGVHDDRYEHVIQQQLAKLLAAARST